jgi:phosphoglycolate phosphatase-like HAD superfamily hydrolase
MEDGPPKPSGAPVDLSLQKLNAKHAWMLGDTKDDIEAARSARVLPIGIIAPKASIGPTSELLLHAGASVVLNKWTEIMELLP